MGFASMSATEFRERGQRRGRGQKYHNKKVTLPDGQVFDSRAEHRHWLYLQALQRAGEISDLQCQVPFVLAPAVKLGGRTKPALRYVADFVYRDKAGAQVVADVKGASTDVWRIKRHLMMTVHGIEVMEVRA